MVTPATARLLVLTWLGVVAVPGCGTCRKPIKAYEGSMTGSLAGIVQGIEARCANPGGEPWYGTCRDQNGKEFLWVEIRGTRGVTGVYSLEAAELVFARTASHLRPAACETTEFGDRPQCTATLSLACERLPELRALASRNAPPG